ncbi:MAG: type II toxin-antitoxin system PemK/MazF family toxin [Chloroflexi bacterium]|nr:type II toxin-antitoxin system PemK/MazF family toxin [Chloroflexota bacterium]
MTSPLPSRGDLWLVSLDPTRGHEQAGVRPALVVSVDLFSQGPAELVVVVPLTTTARGIPLHVEVAPPEGGLKLRSYIKCEDIRSLSRHRLMERWGTVSPDTIAEVEERLRILLGL